jgi:hypothetical protein
MFTTALGLRQVLLLLLLLLAGWLTAVGFSRRGAVMRRAAAPSPLFTAAHSSSCAWPGSRITAPEPSLPLQQ